MKVFMLAAGTSARLGIDEFVLGGGHHQQDFEHKITDLGALDYVRTVMVIHGVQYIASQPP